MVYVLSALIVVTLFCGLVFYDVDCTLYVM